VGSGSFIDQQSSGDADLGSESELRAEALPVLRVLIVQNHPLLASTIAKILEAEAGIEVCGVARTGAEAALVSAREGASVVLMDFRLPDMSGPAAAGMVRAGTPSAAIVFHSADDSETALLDAIDAGAAAYLTKTATADEIIEGVKRAGRGEVLIPASLFAKAIARQRQGVTDKQDQERLLALFTQRELEVLHLLAEGLDTIAMSKRLGVAGHTIEWHVRHVIEKLGAHSKLQAVIAAARLGLIEL
jgi:two-component system, NarL family, nitrate/nitrite response regulator NarL